MASWQKNNNSFTYEKIPPAALHQAWPFEQKCQSSLEENPYSDKILNDWKSLHYEKQYILNVFDESEQILRNIHA